MQLSSADEALSCERGAGGVENPRLTRVAVLISGGNSSAEAMKSMAVHLVEPLLQQGVILDIFACLQQGIGSCEVPYTNGFVEHFWWEDDEVQEKEGGGSQEQDENAIKTVRRRKAGFHVQFSRWEALYRATLAHRVNEYDWVIRSRPDLHFFAGCLPPVAAWNRNVLMVRARIYPPDSCPDPAMCSWTSTCHAKRFVYDDQFFVLPSKLAGQVFTSKLGSEPAVGKKLGNWAEHQFTRILASHCVPVEVTPLRVRITKHLQSFPFPPAV